MSNQYRFDFWFSLESLAYGLGISRFAPFKAKRGYLSPEFFSNSAEAFSKDADRYR